LSGSVRKCTEMGRPLPSVSINGSSGYVTSSAAACTHVLSFACFKLSRNFSPIAVVDAAVSPPSSASVCTRRPCQQTPLSRSQGSSPVVHARASGELVVLRRRGGAVQGEGRSLVEPSPSSRALPIHHPQPSHIATICLHRPEPPPTPPHAIITTRGARTGSFWRFDGRPSFSGAAAPVALRFAALSMLGIRRRVD